ncbi:Bifunctional coenzyme A synthase [Schistosoma japonicum]|nr:Bifunctional coenzyme A synthase [Schistosoma japonicum]
MKISFNECKSCPFDPSDFKLCSSKLRFNELGNLLKPVNNINFDDSPCSPYLIGLTGPSGSEPPYPIDRSLLGRLVFSDPTLLKDLNSIVWPEILRKILTIVEEIKYKALEQDQNHKRPVIILDAAVLLQAKWDKMCHEVWLTVLPQSEAQRRLCERNNLSPKAASERLERQASAVAEVTGGYTWFEAGQYHSYKSPLDYAHVILSTEWDPECSQYQVEKSWKALQQRL